MKSKKLTYCGIATTKVEEKLTNGFRLIIRLENFYDVTIVKGNAIKGTLVTKLDRKLTKEEMNLSLEALVASFK